MMKQENTDFDMTVDAGLQQAICAEIRAVLYRPDLSNETLLAVLDRDAPARTGGLSPDAFKRALGRPEDRLRLIRSLAVPPQRHGLDMPEHDLDPPLGLRLAPLARLWQRVLPSALAQMKRVPAIARNR